MRIATFTSTLYCVESRFCPVIHTGKQGEQGATPAGWPNNELIGDQVIVPLATDEATAAKRAQEYECYDCWFCHKPLQK